MMVPTMDASSLCEAMRGSCRNPWAEHWESAAPSQRSETICEPLRMKDSDPQQIVMPEISEAPRPLSSAAA